MTGDTDRLGSNGAEGGREEREGRDGGVVGEGEKGGREVRRWSQVAGHGARLTAQTLEPRQAYILLPYIGHMDLIPGHKSPCLIFIFPLEIGTHYSSTHPSAAVKTKGSDHHEVARGVRGPCRGPCLPPQMTWLLFPVRREPHSFPARVTPPSFSPWLVRTPGSAPLSGSLLM